MIKLKYKSLILIPSSLPSFMKHVNLKKKKPTLWASETTQTPIKGLFRATKKKKKLSINIYEAIKNIYASKHKASNQSPIRKYGEKEMGKKCLVPSSSRAQSY